MPSSQLGSASGWASYGCRDQGREALPLVFSVLHYMYDGDGVLSRGALKALKAYIACCAEVGEGGNWARCLEANVMPVVKNGVLSKSDAPRRAFVLLFRTLATTFGPTHGSHPNPSPLLFGDLEALIGQDDEVDFFFNVTHVQIHRRTRALLRLRKEFESSSLTFSGATLSNFLAPICTHPIFEAAKSTDEALALEGGKTLGAVAGGMKWGAYTGTLALFFAQIPRHAEVERFLVAALCSVLDNFSFRVAGEGEEAVDGVVALKSVEKILDKIEKLLFVEGKDKDGSRTKSLRAPIALAILKLIQMLPKESFEGKFESLVLSVCKELKSKESNSRDVARSTLGRISVASGLENFGVILRNLSITLSEGYQLHVRSATLHTCVLAYSEDKGSREEASKGGALDSWISEIVDLVQEDIFGMAAEMKETKDVGKRVIKEAVGVRSYDTVELLSGMVRFRPDEEGNAVRALVDPFINRLNDEESKVNMAVIKKVAEVRGSRSEGETSY